MLSFVKLNENAGTWANRDKALEFLKEGYHVYTSETMEKELTESDIRAIVEEGSAKASENRAEG